MSIVQGRRERHPRPWGPGRDLATRTVLSGLGLVLIVWTLLVVVVVRTGRVESWPALVGGLGVWALAGWLVAAIDRNERPEAAAHPAPRTPRGGRLGVRVEFCGGPFDGEVLHFARLRGPEIVIPRLVPPKPGAPRTHHYISMGDDAATGRQRYRYAGPDMMGEDPPR